MAELHSEALVMLYAHPQASMDFVSHCLHLWLHSEDWPWATGATLLPRKSEVPGNLQPSRVTNNSSLFKTKRFLKIIEYWKPDGARKTRTTGHPMHPPHQTPKIDSPYPQMGTNFWVKLYPRAPCRTQLRLAFPLLVIFHSVSGFLPLTSPCLLEVLPS